MYLSFTNLVLVYFNEIKYITDAVLDKTQKITYIH